MKDTTGYLRKLNAIKSVPDNVYLVALNAKSLYTSIPNAEGINSAKESEKCTSKNVATKVIPTFFAVILTLNNIVFNCKHDRQIKCLSMGTLYAPSYANIFMDSFEKIYVYIYIPFPSRNFIDVLTIH